MINTINKNLQTGAISTGAITRMRVTKQRNCKRQRRVQNKGARVNTPANMLLRHHTRYKQPAMEPCRYVASIRWQHNYSSEFTGLKVERT